MLNTLPAPQLKLMPFACAILMASCSGMPQTLPAPLIIEAPKIQPLPAAARQPKRESEASPSWSERLTTLRKQLSLTLIPAEGQGSSASAPTTP